MQNNIFTCKHLTRQKCNPWREILSQKEFRHPYFKHVRATFYKGKGEKEELLKINKDFNLSADLYPSGDKEQGRQREVRWQRMRRREWEGRRRMEKARVPLEGLQQLLLQTSTVWSFEKKFPSLPKKSVYSLPTSVMCSLKSSLRLFERAGFTWRCTHQ